MTSNTTECQRDFSTPQDDIEWNYPLKLDEIEENGSEMFVYVNRHCLAALSPVFRKIFFDPSFEDSSKDCLKMSGKVPSEFLEFIRCIAFADDGVSHKHIDADNVEILLRYAEEYQIGYLKRLCAEFFDSLRISLSIETTEKRGVFTKSVALIGQYNLNRIYKLDKLIDSVSRFPFDELRPIGVATGHGEVYAQLLERKTARYHRIAVHTADVFRVEHTTNGLNDDAKLGCVRCALKNCHSCRDKDARKRFYSCVQNGPGDNRRCLLGDAGPYCYDCYKKHHEPMHRIVHSYCPDCKHRFYPSAEGQMDRCDCAV